MFGQAIGYMVSRGESEKGVNADYNDMRAALPPGEFVTYHLSLPLSHWDIQSAASISG